MNIKLFMIIVSANFLVCAFAVFAETPHLTRPATVTTDPEWDWIQLTSGEWLKGEILGMERENLEFDSDNLGDLDLDWEDIAAIYSNKIMAVLLKGRRTAVGKITTLGDKWYVGDVEFVNHDDILGIAASAPRGLDLWDGSISAGLTLRSGNVDQKDINVASRFTRRTASSTGKVNYTGNFSENNQIRSADNHRLTTSYDYRLSQKWFVQILQAEYFRDDFQNIAHQWQAGFGASYYIVENHSLLWTFSAGPGYRVTIYDEVPEFDDRRSSTSIFTLSTEYDQELTSSIDLYALYTVTFEKKATTGTKQHLNIALDVDLIGELDLTVGFYADYTESPQVNADGIIPEELDTRLTVGVSYDL